MSCTERAVASEQVRRQLETFPAWKSARSILAFVPTAGEPDVWPAIQTAHAAGVRVHLPGFDAGSGTYAPRWVPGLEADLVPGQHGIREPNEACPGWDGNALDLILVPGLGFTPSGARLGRGKGHYDRLLARVPGLKCGVAFDVQMIPDIPLEPHDIRLDLIVTPSLRFGWPGAAGASGHEADVAPDIHDCP